jgi:hypothetical protein
VGMYTTDWDWLNNLKPGDKVDCCDKYGIWHMCHISCVRDKGD